MSSKKLDEELWDAARERLRAAIDRAGSRQSIAEKAGISASALSTLLGPKGSTPSASRLARVATAANVSIDYILTGAALSTLSDVAYLPVATAVTASAGHGSIIDGEEALSAVPFPTRWLRQEFGDPANLALIQVEGDSMSPDFPDGSWVMFDRGRRGPATGTYVIRLHGVVNIKDVQFRAIDIQITSKHVGYEGAQLSLEEAADPSIFEVLGRVVWSGNLLA